MMNKNDQIQQFKDALQPLQPSVLEIIDESERHHGHGGWKEGIVTHIHLKIGSKKFVDQNRISIHKSIYALLDKYLLENLHSIKITIVGCL